MQILQELGRRELLVARSVVFIILQFMSQIIGLRNDEVRLPSRSHHDFQLSSGIEDQVQGADFSVYFQDCLEHLSADDLVEALDDILVVDQGDGHQLIVLNLSNQML